MTKEEAKELLPIIAAFAEGETIEVKGSYGEWVETISPDFGNGPKNYRIKSKPRYRPFFNNEECWQEIQKHQPLGWLDEPKTQYSEHSRQIIVGLDDSLVYMNEYSRTYEDAFNNATFVDGSPFGIKEE